MNVPSPPRSPVAPVSFDVRGPLPRGVTVLEASAGTGKTFTIAALVARYVAEGIPLDALLVITFTRMATGELRERVRDRLVAAELALRDVRAGRARPLDEVEALLAEGTADEVAARHARLATAVADFDAATIITVHGFCHQVLTGLGVAGAVDRDARLTANVDALRDEVVTDLYVRRFLTHPLSAELSFAEAREVARQATVNPDALLRPDGEPIHTPSGMRVSLAKAVRRELGRRTRRAGHLTYDDLLHRLRDTLVDDERGPVAGARLRARYRVALVDEFQDTDGVQWDIMRTAFDHPEATLVLIGDPKQAIYAFRGADVWSYLDAAAVAGRRATLDASWRTDQGLLDAYDLLFGGAQLGHPEILYRPVRAARPEAAVDPSAPPLRVRVVHREDANVRLTSTGLAETGSARQHVAEDVAADIARQLRAGATLPDMPEPGVPEASRAVAEGGTRPLQPGDIAVLVRTNIQGAQVRDALADRNVPAVISGAGSVFATPAAAAWLRLLEALERPSDGPRAHTAALTPFLGLSPAEIAAADDAAWEEVHVALHRWAELLRTRGVAALMEAVSVTRRLPARVLAGTGGERELTDLRHVAQLLHAAAAREQLGVTALTGWIRQQVADSGTGDEEQSRRLESDAEAVQVLTIHGAKGLEFPVVYCPYLWDGINLDAKRAIPVFHDPDRGGARTLDLQLRPNGLRGSADSFARYTDEERGEELRLAYVALTRARHRAVVWWAASWNSRRAPLTRLLLARDAATGEVASELDESVSDAGVTAAVAELADRRPGRIAVERAGAEPVLDWAPPTRTGVDLSRRRLGRELDVVWRRSSYTAIAAAAHDAAVASEADDGHTDDRADDEGITGLDHAASAAAAPDEAEDSAQLRSVGSPLAGVPGGAEIGSLVHRVLEQTDFAAPDLTAQLDGLVAVEQARSGLDVGDPARLAAGLATTAATPLGPLARERRLADLARADRLDELWFELPIGGGEHPTGAAVRLAALADLLRVHLPPEDPLVGYADVLRRASLPAVLRGYLIGSLDLVVRWREDGRDVFAVADYKTSVLGPPGRPPTAWDYRPAALAAAMQRAHYPLQALFYLVALDRYLRGRVPGYDPDTQLAGVWYLYLRGMAGAEAPRVAGAPCGVLAWRPPTALIRAVGDLLDHGEAPA